MTTKLYALVRFFKTEAHRDSFLRGDLYMNRLKYFKAYEEEDVCNIGDKHEGTIGWFQPGQVKLKIQIPETGEEFVIEDFAAPVVMGLNRHDDYHVYCMSAIHVDDEARFETFEEMRSSMMLDVKKGDLGDYCSIVDVSKFIGRLDKALKAEQKAGNGYSRALVEYFDPDTFNGSFDENEAIFRKKNCFSHQKEYRICVDNGTSGDDPRVINMGDISDIVFNCSKADFHRHVIMLEND